MMGIINVVQLGEDEGIGQFEGGGGRRSQTPFFIRRGVLCNEI